MNPVIIGTGSYLPETVVANDDIERAARDYDRARVGVSLDTWARQQTGIAARHRAAPGEGTSDMAAVAARRALDDARLKAGDLDLIVMSTIASDYRFPNSAALLQARLGATCKFYQIEHACSGFVDAAILTSALMEALGAETALVCSSEAMSLYCDPRSFTTQSRFGDGAGCAILKRGSDPRYGLKAHDTGADGQRGDWAMIPGGGVLQPPGEALLASGDRYLRLQDEAFYPFQVETLAGSVRAVVKRAGRSLEQIDWFVISQVGRNFIADVARELGRPLSKFLVSSDHTGDTSGAALPIALDEANRAGQLKDGDALALAAAGIGLAWGALYLDWYNYKR